MKGMRVWLGIGALMASLTNSTMAELRLPKAFSDHMVLQRDIAAPVWGWAEPG